MQRSARDSGHREKRTDHQKVDDRSKCFLNPLSQGRSSGLIIAGIHDGQGVEMSRSDEPPQLNWKETEIEKNRTEDTRGGIRIALEDVSRSSICSDWYALFFTVKNLALALSVSVSLFFTMFGSCWTLPPFTVISNDMPVVQSGRRNMDSSFVKRSRFKCIMLENFLPVQSSPSVRAV